jgi:NAD-dependent dihydropyrimidine dehydrogenase PreA subunit
LVPPHNVHFIYSRGNILYLSLSYQVASIEAIRTIFILRNYLINGCKEAMQRKILFCNCGGKIIEEARKNEIAEFLKDSTADVIQLSDLCGLSVTEKETTYQMLKDAEELLIIACYPRTLHLLLKDIGIKPDTIPTQVLNFKELDNESIFKAVQASLENSGSPSAFETLSTKDEWIPWFPIIDKERCTDCGQCANFCLFGVYEYTDQKVKVVYPQGCKNNCPACARICPHTAIIFPKYIQGGAISGSDVIDEVAEQQRQLQDMDSILGSDIYSALEQRKIRRQSIIRNEEMKKAMAEREKALKENNKNV